MFQKISVCGGGTMGAGIAQVAAQNGIETTLFDVDPLNLKKGESTIEKNLQSLVDRNKMEKDRMSQTMNLLSFTTNIKDCSGEIVIEAIVEKLEAKIELFNRIAEIVPAETILASNTSSLSIYAIASKIPHPARVVGMHFFNPAPFMKLVEIVSTNLTGPMVIDAVALLARKMNKVPVFCKDAPGFIVNHVARPFYIQSLRLLEEGVADIEVIDRLLENVGFRMGPFRLMDLIGNDINYAVSCSVYESMNRPARLKPSLIQEKKVRENQLGKKTGKGYYDYS
ncbi:MAG: 3-hydroxybutyryl-CoA dehydrogenase [Bacteroidetes bacterium]|nr:MAG: 3-hydroxybutyryl-CoA dehydrogenase [Bacteroidota bacterium]